MSEPNGYHVAEELDAYLTARQTDPQASQPHGLPRDEAALAEALVDLAAATVPDPAFVANLEARLSPSAESDRPSRLLTTWRNVVTTIGRQTMNRQMRSKTLLPLTSVAALLVLLAGALFLSSAWPGARTASAAELLNRADEALAAQAGDAAVVYDRLSLSWEMAAPNEGVTAELWQAGDGARFRYQLTATDGTLLYFLQRDGDRIWQSIHPRPVGAAGVQQVIEQPAADPAPPPEGALLHGDLSVGWTDFTWLLSEHRAACTGLYCLLGVDGAEDDGVTAGPVTEETVAGQPVYAVTLTMPGDWRRTVRLDQETAALVEVVDEEDGNLVARLHHVERRALPAGALAADFFRRTPPGVELTSGEIGASGAADTVRLFAVAPQPGAPLSGATTFTVTVGYDLNSVPEAMLRVDLARPGFADVTEGRAPIVGGEQVTVSADQHEAIITFAVDWSEEAWLGPGEMAPLVTLGHFTGAGRLENLADHHFLDVAWEVAP